MYATNQLVYGRMTSAIQIPGELEIEPKLGFNAEQFFQSQGGIRGHSSASMDQFVQPRIGDLKLACQFALRQPQRHEEFFLERFARMRGRAVGGNANHIFLLVIIDDLHMLRPGVSPAEAEAKLFIDPDRVLSCSVAS